LKKYVQHYKFFPKVSTLFQIFEYKVLRYTSTVTLNVELQVVGYTCSGTRRPIRAPR